MFVLRSFVTISLASGLLFAEADDTPAPSTPDLAVPVPRKSLDEATHQALLNALKRIEPKQYGGLARLDKELGDQLCSIPLTAIKVDTKSRYEISKPQSQDKTEKNPMRNFDRMGVAPLAASCSQAWAADQRNTPPRTTPKLK